MEIYTNWQKKTLCKTSVKYFFCSRKLIYTHVCQNYKHNQILHSKNYHKSNVNWHMTAIVHVADTALRSIAGSCMAYHKQKLE